MTLNRYAANTNLGSPGGSGGTYHSLDPSRQQRVRRRADDERRGRQRRGINVPSGYIHEAFQFSIRGCGPDRIARFPVLGPPTVG